MTEKSVAKQDAEEIKEILSVVSTEVPGLIRNILASVFSEEAGRSMGKAAAAFYKELLFTAYDATVAATTGIPTRLMEYGLLALVAVSTVVALQTVGIVLVIAMLVTPAATASLLVRRLHQVIFAGVGVALASSVIGLYVSYHAGVASGAAIVLVATAFFTVALLFAPRRGLLARRRPERALP